jgi:aryl-alcohol dehydrogenase-like predicted oxidoreductase
LVEPSGATDKGGLVMRMLEDSTVGTVSFGHDLTVRRLGFGAMRVSGARNQQGERDRSLAVHLCRRIVERGVNFIDTANIYGYGQSEEIIADALRPYPDGLLVATKAGFKPGKIAPGETSLPPLGRPEHIKEECDKSLRRLRLDVIDLYQVHVPDPDVPYEETVGAFVELQQAGKIRHIGVSNVTLEQLQSARSLCQVVSVQNRYNAGDRWSEAVLQECERLSIPFLPWQPAQVEAPAATMVLGEVAARRQATLQQVAIAWLLQRSPLMVPIPGTSKVEHLDGNIDAAWVNLTADDVQAINAIVSTTEGDRATPRLPSTRPSYRR